MEISRNVFRSSKNRKVSNQSQIIVIEKIYIRIHEGREKIAILKRKKLTKTVARGKMKLKHVSFISKIIIYLHIFIALYRIPGAKSENSKKDIFYTSNESFFHAFDDTPLASFLLMTLFLIALFACVRHKKKPNEYIVISRKVF